MSANVEATTGGLFQDPSSGVASSVLPKFQPGLRAANAAEAVMGVKVPVQEDVAVAETELDEDFDVEEDFEDALAIVDKVVATELDLLVELDDLLVALELAVPGTH
jgi:hypothetical protein